MSKRLRNAVKNFDLSKIYKINEAISFFTKNYFLKYKAKFNETIECVIKLNSTIDKNRQEIAGTVIVANNLGKEKKIAVIVDSAKVQELKHVKVNSIGSQDLIEKIKNGFCDFDVCIASPSMMPKIYSIGNVLGPKGLMPNPKFGTVTDNIKSIVQKIRKGQVKFKSDKGNIIHAGIAKIDFKNNEIRENLLAFYKAVLDLKPVKHKGIYIKNLFLSSTNGPSIKLDLKSFLV